jgi:hypothetical protein
MRMAVDLIVTRRVMLSPFYNRCIAPRVACGLLHVWYVRVKERASCAALTERPIDLLSIVPAPGERPGPGGEAQARPSSGRPSWPGKRHRRAAYPAGRAAASKRRTGRRAARKAGPAGSTATPPFFSSFLCLFFYLFTSSLSRWTTKLAH